MEAPEKIWINPSMDLPKLNGVIDKDSIQYVRKDIFIKKALYWLKKNFDSYSYPSHLMFDDFREYLDKD